MAGPAFVRRTGICVTIHAKTHLKTGFVNPAVCCREFLMTCRTGDVRVLRMSEKDVRRHPVNFDPIDSGRKSFLGVTLFT